MSEWVRLGAILPSQLELFWMIFGLRVNMLLKMDLIG